MKAVFQTDVKTGEQIIIVKVRPKDFEMLELEASDWKIIGECGSSGKVSDKFLMLELLARRFEQLHERRRQSLGIENA